MAESISGYAMLNGNIILHTDWPEIGNKDSQMNLNYITIDCMEYMCVEPFFILPGFLHSITNMRTIGNTSISVNI